MAMEHRWGPRRATNVRVRVLAHSGAIGTGQVLNVSYTGAYLQTTLPLPAASVIDLEPAWQEGAATRPRRFAAAVVRQDAHGVGLEWCETNADITIYFTARLTSAGMPRELAPFRTSADR
jgi:hypothetical protein